MPLTERQAHERALSILDRAADLRGDERRSYLEQACDGDDDLRSLVDSALAEADGDSTFLNTPAPMPGAPRPAGLPSELAGYRILDLLGSGGMGDVYLAEEPFPRRLVALKVIRLGPLSGSAVERFEREAGLLGRLEHPSVARLHRAGTVDSASGPLAYLAMQYVEGRTLARLLDGAEPLFLRPPTADATRTSTPTRSDEIERVLGWIETLARALAAAHAVGVVHRDVKPQNVIITPANEAVLVDFGVAHDLSGELHKLTATGLQSPGTPAYMSPEQMGVVAGAVDARSDVWSLGVLLYECLCGRRPFEGDSRVVLADVIAHRDPADPRRSNPSLPRDLVAVLDRALEKAPSRRYASALAFADDIARVRKGEPTVARPVTGVGRVLRRARRHPLVSLGCAAGLALLATVWMTSDAARRDAVEATTEAALAFARVADARRVGAEPPSADWKLVCRYLPDDGARARLLQRPGDAETLVTYLAGVASAHRGSGASAVALQMSPRAAITEQRPGLSAQLPDGARVASVRLQGEDGPVTLLSADVAGPWTPATDLPPNSHWEWSLTLDDGSVHTAPFQVLSPLQRDARLAALDDAPVALRGLLRAAVLVDLSLGLEALTELQQLNDLPPSLVEQQAWLTAQARTLLGLETVTELSFPKSPPPS